MKYPLLIVFSLLLNSCSDSTKEDNINVSNKGERLSNRQYEIINEAYLLNSLDTVRPLRIYEHVSKANMITAFRYLQIEKYLKEELNFTNDEIVKIKEAINADYFQIEGQYADTSFTFNPKRLSKEIIVISKDSIEKLEPTQFFNLTIISEPIIDSTKNIALLFETFHIAERILIFKMKDGKWSLIKSEKAEHSE